MIKEVFIHKIDTHNAGRNMTLIDGIYFFLKQLLFAVAQVNWESKKPDSDGNFYGKRRNQSRIHPISWCHQSQPCSSGKQKAYSSCLYIMTAASRLLPAPKWDLYTGRSTIGKNPKRQTMVRWLLLIQDLIEDQH